MRQTCTMLLDGENAHCARPIVERLMSGVVFNCPVLFTVSDLFERITDGRMQLWLFSEPEEEPHLFAITLVERFPQGNVAYIALMAGRDFGSATSFASRFEEWARQIGANYIRFECSPKMAKIMKRYGYSATAMTVFKSLYVAN